MKKNIDLSIAKTGMSRDLASDALDQKTYSLAYNMNIENASGNQFKLKSEPSNLLAVKFEDGFKVIGKENDINTGFTYYFLANPTTGVSEIGIVKNTKNINSITDVEVKCPDCDFRVILEEPLEKINQIPYDTYTTLLEDSCNACLNFNVRFPIKTIIIKNEKASIKIFFTDNLNPPRYLDLSKLDEYKTVGVEVCDVDNRVPVCVDCDKLRMFPTYRPIEVYPAETVLGGNLRLAQYSFYIAICDSLGNELSEYTSLTNPVSLFDTNNKILTELEESQRTNYAIKLSVKNIDNKFSYYKIVAGVTNIVDSGTRYFDLGVFPITTQQVLFASEADKLEISINDVLQPNLNINLLEGLATSNNFLLGYGITREKEWNLQPVVNLLGGFVKWQTHIALENIYEDGVNTSLYKGYCRDEVYPLAIRFITNTGYKTAKFPLISRPPTASDLEEVVSIDKNSINANLKSCQGASRNKRWQIYNTASEIGSCGQTSLPTSQVIEPSIRTCITEAVVTASPGTITLNNPEDFTTLKDFLNDILEDGGCNNPTEFPFCNIINPDLYADCIPNYEDNCNNISKVASLMLVSEVTGDGDNGQEKTTITFLDFPTEYSKLKGSSVCNPHRRSAEGAGFIYDDEFTRTYILNPGGDVPGDFRAFEREDAMFNTSPLYAEELNEILNVTQQLPTSYYHTWRGYPDLPSAQITNLNVTCLQNNAYTDKVHKESLWFKVEQEKLQEDKIFEITRLVPDDVGRTHVFLNESVRVSIFTTINGVSVDTVFCKILDLEDNGYQLLLEVDTDLNTLTFKESDADIGVTIPLPNSGLFIAVEAPIRQSGGSLSGGYYAHPTKGCFGVALRDLQIKKIDIDYTSIVFDKLDRFIADCSFDIPILSDCDVVPHKYGEFAYNESTETYPDNKELYDSSRLKIQQIDFTSNEIRSEFLEKYAEDITLEGTYLLKEDTDFSCKKIRHFKFPDNKVSPFMFEFPQASFSRSLVYPLGVTINEEVINTFLNVAVKNNLITQAQRDSIVSYEIFRGDRTLNKSVVAKGLMYDLYNYEEDNKTIHFSNFPYNSLGDNELFLNKERTSLTHPHNSDFNHKFTFHSPDTEFYKPILPTDLVVEGYMFGKSKGVFNEVDEHPRYVILGRKAERLASTLATLEVVAEAAVIAAMSAETFRATFGFSNSINPVGIGLSLAATALNVISSAVFKYGRYKYEWQQTFLNLGDPKNFASYYTSVGEYNYLRLLQEPDNITRGIQKAAFIKDGRYSIINEVSGERVELNNIDRENSVFLNIGEAFPIVYPDEFKDYDNFNLNKQEASRFVNSTTFDCSEGKSQEYNKNIASAYVALKNYLPSQYGNISSVRWLTTSYKGDLLNPKTECLPIFGGDIFISRHTLKRKTPLFLTSAMGLASRTPFNYRIYSNYGEQPRYYANFLSPDELTFDRGLPEVKTEYKFDCSTGERDFYVKKPSKFYLYYYGIPSFLTETVINTNFRTARPEPENLFYPVIEDYAKWTQENFVSIRQPNKYLYNNAYSSNPLTTISRTLPPTYSQELYDTLRDEPNGVVNSLPDNSENELSEPWLIFKPLNRYEFPTELGKLTELRGIESGQVFGRFENNSAIFNAVDVLVDGINQDNAMLGTGGLFAKRPITFSETDLGYSGSQSFSMVSCEYGHFFADAKRGQVFQLGAGGKGLTEISAFLGDQPSGMRNWFKEHLPFKIQNNIIENYENIDVDNPYNGIGIVMGWDSRFKRVFLTKRDYLPKKPGLAYCGKDFVISDVNHYQSTIDDYVSQGFTFKGIENCNLKFEREVQGVTTNTDIYVYFDTTSMVPADAQAALEGITTWFTQFQIDNPTYQGNLYTIPTTQEGYLILMWYIVSGTTLQFPSLNTSPGWSAFFNLPPNANTANFVIPEDLLVINFIDEADSQYHNADSNSFGDQPRLGSNLFVDNYMNFKNDFHKFGNFKALMYPVVRLSGAQASATQNLILHLLAAIEGRTLTQNEIDITGTQANVSSILTTNPYENYILPDGSTYVPLKEFGFYGIYDKVSPATEVFSSEAFQKDLNRFISTGLAFTETQEVPIPLEVVELTNKEYFEDVSWTIAYSLTTNSWLSYYDFKPNYYINHNNYFQTGLNVSPDESELGVWSHLLTKKSYGVFYGKKYEVGFEFPYINSYSSKTLESIEIWSEAVRHQEDYAFSYNRDLNFNKLVISNHRESTGNLELIPQKTLRDNLKYPKTLGDKQQILATNTNDRWQVNYIYNRASSEYNNQPLWTWDVNQIKKTVNTKAVKFSGKRVLERLRGNFFLTYLGYDLDSRYEISFKWSTIKEELR